MTKVWLRWTPAVAAVAVVAGVAIAVPAAANASVSLPVKTPEQVLALVASSHVTALSGTIDETSNLGLPSLPSSLTGSAGGSDSGLAADLALLTGTNSLRVYVDGPKDVRLQVLDSLAESDVIRHNNDVWIYDSKANTVSHATISAASHYARPGSKPGVNPGSPMGTTPQGISGVTTPSALATKLLAALEPSSRVTVGADVRVAGRTAYDLVLTPKVNDSLLGSVSIAIDSATGLPLGVSATARGATTPAVSIEFSSLSLAKPDASLFDFTPPAGAKVTQLTTHDSGTKPKAPAGQKLTHAVTGHGWDAVVTLSGDKSLSKLTSSPEFGELTTAVVGGRVLSTTLVNILFTSDGRVLVGSVSVARLEAVATAQ